MDERRKHGQRKRKYSPRVHEIRERDRRLGSFERLNSLPSHEDLRSFLGKTEPSFYTDADLTPMEKGVEYQID